MNRIGSIPHVNLDYIGYFFISLYLSLAHDHFPMGDKKLIVYVFVFFSKTYYNKFKMNCAPLSVRSSLGTSNLVKISLVNIFSTDSSFSNINFLTSTHFVFYILPYFPIDFFNMATCLGCPSRSFHLRPFFFKKRL